MNTLEPGCLAIVTGACFCPENLGKVVTVGQHVGPLEDWIPGDYWEVSPPLLGRRGLGQELDAHHYPGKWLMRIDNHQKEQEQSDVRTPETVTGNA